MSKQDVVVRSADSGAWFGRMVSKAGTEVVLEDAIRLWYWDGAASLSQIALEGVRHPENCKFAVPVDVTVLGVCEIITATESATASVRGVPSWKA